MVSALRTLLTVHAPAPTSNVRTASCRNEREKSRGGAVDQT